MSVYVYTLFIPVKFYNEAF